MRLWSVPSAAETALHIKDAGQRYKQAAKYIYLGDADELISLKLAAASALRGPAPESVNGPTPSYVVESACLNRV